MAISTYSTPAAMNHHHSQTAAFRWILMFRRSIIPAVIKPVFPEPIRILTAMHRSLETGEQKSICNRIVYEMIERTSSPDGQMFLEPDIELNMFWTNLGETDQEIIELYHAHGESEQFHSEIKSDMGVERLPSGKFDTNELVLELTIIAYNILRMLGQETIQQGKAPSKRIVTRKRIRTLIQNLIHFAGHLTKHARRLFLAVSKSNAWAYSFLGLVQRFVRT